MTYRKISERWRYHHCRDLGVAADYCVLQYRFAADSDRPGWRSVATCHPSAIDTIKRDGVKAHLDLIKIHAAESR